MTQLATNVSKMDGDILIVGAGVVGAACALALQKEGRRVLLVDRQAPCAGASFGNAGAIVNGSCVPTAMPGIIFDVLSMLRQSHSPLTIRPEYLPKILPWLIRFLWQSRASKAKTNAQHLQRISKHAVNAWRSLIDNTKLSNFIEDKGWLKVYETEQSFAASAKARQLMDEMGTPYELLTSTQIRELEPNLAPIFNYGFFQSDSLNIINPKKLVEGMVDLFVERGGTFQQFGVDKVTTIDNKVNCSGPQGVLSAKKVLIATGAWSSVLAKHLGDNIPLDTERGYHLMLPESTRNLLSRPVVNADSSFVLSPLDTGLRMTSQVEFAGLSGLADYTRIRSLLPFAKRMLPKIDCREESVWMGFRPSLPDSLPVIGFSSQSKNILYAFGHQHLGMTLGPITALLIADLIAGKETRIPLEPYRVNRF